MHAPLSLLLSFLPLLNLAIAQNTTASTSDGGDEEAPETSEPSNVPTYLPSLSTLPATNTLPVFPTITTGGIASSLLVAATPLPGCVAFDINLCCSGKLFNFQETLTVEELTTPIDFSATSTENSVLSTLPAVWNLHFGGDGAYENYPKCSGTVYRLTTGSVAPAQTTDTAASSAASASASLKPTGGAVALSGLGMGKVVGLVGAVAVLL